MILAPILLNPKIQTEPFKAFAKEPSSHNIGILCFGLCAKSHFRFRIVIFNSKFQSYYRRFKLIKNIS